MHPVKRGEASNFTKVLNRLTSNAQMLVIPRSDSTVVSNRLVSSREMSNMILKLKIS